VYPPKRLTLGSKESSTLAQILDVMRRIVITIVITIAALIGGVILIRIGVLAFALLCSPPSLEVTGESHKKDFAVHFLGEYCDSPSNVTLTEMTTNAVVWSVEIKPDVSFCYFSLSSGNNFALQQGISRVIVPANQTTFTLMPKTKYKITVRRAGSTTSCGVGSTTFEF